MKINPLEIAYRYVLPSVRRRLIEIMYRDLGMNQVEIAGKLGITQSAVSKYVDGKRGTLIDLSKYADIDNELKELAKELTHHDVDEYYVQFRLVKIALAVLSKGYFCGYHVKLDDTVDPSKCGICEKLF